MKRIRGENKASETSPKESMALNEHFPKDSRRNKILSAFIENNRQLSDRIVFDLADLELKSREDAGQTITDEYLKGKMDRDRCLIRLKEQGYNLWWGSESLWYIIKIEKYTFAPQGPTLSLLVADCLMEFVGGHALPNMRQAKNQKSIISLLVDENLEVKEFSFEWKKI